MNIAFDCDGTLIDFEDQPRTEMVLLARALRLSDHRVIIWSGGGKNYAEKVMRQCFGELKFECFAKFADNVPPIDIAFDDDRMVSGVRTLLMLKRGDLAPMPLLGDCFLCLQHKDDEWADHNFHPGPLSGRLCLDCGTAHRVYKATHQENWGHGEDVPVCDECAD